MGLEEGVGEGGAQRSLSKLRRGREPYRVASLRVMAASYARSSNLVPNPSRAKGRIPGENQVSRGFVSRGFVSRGFVSRGFACPRLPPAALARDDHRTDRTRHQQPGHRSCEEHKRE
jgi:hypothetical protein